MRDGARLADNLEISSAELELAEDADDVIRDTQNGSTSFNFNLRSSSPNKPIVQVLPARSTGGGVGSNGPPTVNGSQSAGSISMGSNGSIGSQFNGSNGGLSGTGRALNSCSSRLTFQRPY